MTTEIYAHPLLTRLLEVTEKRGHTIVTLSPGAWAQFIVEMSNAFECEVKTEVVVFPHNDFAVRRARYWTGQTIVVREVVL